MSVNIVINLGESNTGPMQSRLFTKHPSAAYKKYKNGYGGPGHYCPSWPFLKLYCLLVSEMPYYMSSWTWNSAQFTHFTVSIIIIILIYFRQEDHSKTRRKTRIKQIWNSDRQRENKDVQVAQLSQINRAAGCVTFGWVVGDGVCQTILCIKRFCRARKLKALIFYTINPLLYEKRSLWVFEALFGGLEATYAVHLRLIGKSVVAVSYTHLTLPTKRIV